MERDRIYYSNEAEQRAIAQANTERAALAVTVLIAGLGIGAVLALLFAPADGKRTRRDIGRAEKRFERDVQRRTKPVLDDVREVGEDVIENVKDTLEKARKAIDKIIS